MIEVNNTNTIYHKFNRNTKNGEAFEFSVNAWYVFLDANAMIGASSIRQRGWDITVPPKPVSFRLKANLRHADLPNGEDQYSKCLIDNSLRMTETNLLDTAYTNLHSTRL